jgi:heavy metal sensor kinase
VRPLSIRVRLTLWYTGLLLGILLLISGLSYSMLRRSIEQDLDASLMTVAQIIRDTGYSTPGVTAGPGPEAALLQVLGPESYDKFFQLVDAEGNPGIRSTHLGGRTLPLSALARANAGRGVPTFETIQLSPGGAIRLLTMPVVRDGQLQAFIQIGMPLGHARQAIGRYLETLLVLVPLGVALAAAGGAAISRAALARVDEMSRSARRISAHDLSWRVQLRGTGDELDRLAETLNEMLARLEGAFAHMRRFTADASHELRTPLTALRGGVEVALRSERSTEEYRRVLRSSLEEVERLIRLSEDLLLLSRSTAGSSAARAPVDLEALCVEVLDLGARLAEGREVAVRLDTIGPASVIGDAAALRRAALNLVENAVKYTPAGGKVELSLSCADGHAVLTVRDTGAGIDPSDTERIFEPFVRLDAARARDTGGAGLGLAIARSIVVSHGGTLSVESTLGAGSLFTIRLPLA